MMVMAVGRVQNALTEKKLSFFAHHCLLRSLWYLRKCTKKKPADMCAEHKRSSVEVEGELEKAEHERKRKAVYALACEKNMKFFTPSDPKTQPKYTHCIILSQNSVATFFILESL